MTGREMEEIQPEEGLNTDTLLPEAHDVTHSLYDVTYDVVLRTTTFVASYLIYLLIMFIVLDFWDKLKEPTKQFLRSKIEKYVDRQTIEAYVQLTTSADRPAPRQPAVDENRRTNLQTAGKIRRHAEKVTEGSETGAGEIMGDVAKSEDDTEKIPYKDINQKATGYFEDRDTHEERAQDVEKTGIKGDQAGAYEDNLLDSEQDHVELFVKDTISKALQQFQSEEKLRYGGNGTVL